jgi:hypothetical protein
MLRSWMSAGMLLVGLGGAALVGCGDTASDDGVGGSDDNLKGTGKHTDQTRPSDSDEKKPEQAEPDKPKQDDVAAACAAILCPTNTRCEVEEVQCVRAPCPPIAHCVPIEVEPKVTCATTLCAPDTVCVEGDEGPRCVQKEPTGASCAATTCLVGTTCIETAEGAKCVKQDPTVGKCAVTLCRAGTECIETAEGAQCVEPCTAKCSAGQHCELQEVQCVRAPCPPQPTCVDDVDACATVRCRAGTHCEVKQVQCIRAPCPGIPECVAD